jgi:hypothetical protein
LALETRSGASEEELRKVYLGGFEAGFQSLETGSTLPKTTLPIPRFQLEEWILLERRELTPIFNNPIYARILSS